MTDLNLSQRRSQHGAPIRCLIVEDHQMVAEALAKALADESDIEVVGIQATASSARDFLRHERADVVLMDYHLPDGDGVQAARQIRRDHPSTHVVMVTASNDRKLLNAALSAGCTGFVSKGESLVHLPNAIRSALSGTTAFSPGIVAKLLQPSERGDPSSNDLNDRELTMLRLFAQGWPAEEIADHLFMAPNTLRNYMGRINQKLGTRNRLEAVSKAVRLGLVTLNDDGGDLEDTGRLTGRVHRGR
jgi:DNA-binding NarL/FixJ family response regulator